MKWTIRPASQFFTVRDEWQRLCEERYGGHPFLDARFVEAAINTFADEHVKLAVADGALSALALVRKRSRWVVESFCPSQLPMALLLWDGAAVDGRALRTLLSAGGGQLLGLLHYDELIQQPIEMSPGLMRPVDYAPTMNVELDSDFDDYWKERSKKLQGNISRYQKRAARDGLEIELEEVTAAAAMPAAVDGYGIIESAGWKGRVGSAVCSDNEQGRFYCEVLERFAATDEARVFHLRMNDRIVASRMLVHSGGTVVMLKTTYDEEYSRNAPGRILLYLVLKRLFDDNRLRRVEFYTKASADQLQWATGTRMIRHYNLYRGRSIFALSSMARRLASLRRTAAAKINRRPE